MNSDFPISGSNFLRKEQVKATFINSVHAQNLEL